ncbi:putative R3H domain protein [Talaromyces proteolyticus]|uniref:R3H domain protein n=1 Tax=Talaromyces proteolyticus TaxID=1131652 RepID=A0AAD4PZW4_9EURO|nr:putative R3H domain protein [Talaromyces proteolyticus]KAH8697022.1 putative R3H domain protein [Talaromyces proteolyticus]
MMTSKTSGLGASRPSFAKIAAMAVPPKPQNDTFIRDETEIPAAGELKSPPISHMSSTTLPSQSGQDGLTNIPLDGVIQGLENGVEGLSINQHGSEGSESSDEGRATRLLQREASFDDDQTHLSNSSTKPTSFDSKSMVSVTTFAMDEKDSLRPDDSASVQAADEDESLPGAASGATNSLAGSEAGARGFRDQFREGNPYKIRGLVPTSIQRFPDGDIRVAGTIPPDSVSNNFVVPTQADFQSEQIFNGYPLEPDEKLLEAMSSPKDRLLLLQLEEKIRNFIQDSKEQSLELPPSNAFGRLLAHKLGDYYHLTHFVDNNATSVRLHRTPFCRLPTPLSFLRPVNPIHTPSPNAPAMKIMRRNDQGAERPSAGGSTAASSSVPSKTASESGGDSFNDDDHTGSSVGATPVKDRSAMTREERAAKYQEVRERIFRDFPESQAEESPGGDIGANISRSSSSSGRKKNLRQKTPHDDSFQARSQFNAYYPGMPYTPGPMQMPNGSGYNQSPYMVGPGASPPAMNYPQSTHNPTAYQNMNNVPQYQMNMAHMAQGNSWQASTAPQQSPYSGYAVLNQPPPMLGHAQTRSPSTMNNFPLPNFAQSTPTASPSWTGQPYQGNYSQSPQRSAPIHWQNYSAPSMATNTNPYSYGQPPNQHYPSPTQNMVNHPIPGSYNRPTFNPQTRSFVPGGNTVMGRYPNKAMPHTANVAYGNPQPASQHQWSGYMESNSQSLAHVSPLLSNRNNSNISGPNSMTRVAPAGSNDSIAKWGTPAHLPPKPPPSEVLSEFESPKSRSLG